MQIIAVSVRVCVWVCESVCDSVFECVSVCDVASVMSYSVPPYGL